MTKRRQPGRRMDQHVGHKPDPLVRLVAAHPTEQLLVAIVGPDIRIVDCSTGAVSHMSQEGAHQGAVRFCSFSSDGALLLTGSDDKTSKLWDLPARTCKMTWRMHKKLSAGAFSQDSAYAMFADKFGDVAVVATDRGAPGQGTASQEPELLLGHLCSIVSSVAVSNDNKYIATADRDGRVRISLFPAEPLKGAYEIQAYCLGHTNFVTSATFPHGATHAGGPVLVTGSGDGTVRSWNAATGELLSTYVAAAPRAPAAAAAEAAPAADAADAADDGEAGAGEETTDATDAAGADGAGEGGDAATGADVGGGEGGEEGGSDRSNVPDCAAVLDVAVSRDGKTLTVLVEGEQEIQVLSLHPQTHHLSLTQRYTLQGVTCPCRAAWDSQGRLWVVGGPAVDTSRSLHIATLTLSQDGTLSDVTSEVLSTEAKSQVEQRNPEEEAQVASGKLAGLLTQPMHRKKYENQAPIQKRPRNDHKENLRLAQLRAQQASQGQQSTEQ